MVGAVASLCRAAAGWSAEQRDFIMMLARVMAHDY